MRSLFQKTFFLTLILLALPLALKADTLRLSPDSGTYGIGKTIPVTVYVSSPSQSVNAVSGTLSYPTDKLQVVSVSKVGSVLSLWVAEPTFTNVTGTVSFEGVVPNPGYQGTAGKIMTVYFKVVAAGNATVRWSAGSVLANDGNGTNIIRNLSTASFTLGGTQPVEQNVSKPDPVVMPKQTGGPIVTSSEFPEQKKWYQNTSGTFSWKLPEDASAVRVLVGKLPDSTPTVVYDPPISTKSVSDLDDGIWYFHLQTRTGSSWGPITHYQFRVDSTPPESFIIKALEREDPTNPSPSFNFIAADSASGIDRYTVEIDGGVPLVWHDNGSGIYTAPTLLPGEHNILAKAYDEAGNSVPASHDFVVVPIPGPKVTFYTEDIKEDGLFIAKGTAQAGTKVEVRLVKSGFTSSDNSTMIKQRVEVDREGLWSASLNIDGLKDGIYNFSAVSIDNRGAQSDPTVENTVSVNANWLQSISSSLFKFLVAAVPIVALLILLGMLFIHGLHKVRMTNRKFSRELRNVERLVDKAFVLLKEDVEDSIRLLERTKSRRKLTEEEEAIIIRMRLNLRDAEKVIHNEVRKIESEID